MKTSGLKGSYPLTSTSIDTNVSWKSPGAYMLGYSKGGMFYVMYVGRSDDDVAYRLRQHVGKYSEFKFEYYRTPADAFAKECSLYHDFNPPDNKIHPGRPMGTTYRCPVFACQN